MLLETHRNNFVIYKNELRKYSDDPVIQRKILKDSVVIKKLFISACKVCDPIIIWNNNGSDKTSIASFSKCRSTPHLEIISTHLGTRTRLTLKTLTFFDLIDQVDYEIHYNDIKSIIIKNEDFDKVNELLEIPLVKF